MFRIAGVLAKDREELKFYLDIMNNTIAGQRARHLGGLSKLDNIIENAISDLE